MSITIKAAGMPTLRAVAITRDAAAALVAAIAADPSFGGYSYGEDDSGPYGPFVIDASPDQLERALAAVQPPHRRGLENAALLAKVCRRSVSVLANDDQPLGVPEVTFSDDEDGEPSLSWNPNRAVCALRAIGIAHSPSEGNAYGAARLAEACERLLAGDEDESDEDDVAAILGVARFALQRLGPNADVMVS